MKLTSSVFQHNQKIPKEYTCEGEDLSPPLQIDSMPENTKTLALLMDDPDAPAKVWVHWIIFNIKPCKNIEEDTAPGMQGKNDFGRCNYGGPCPPEGTGVHRYFFKLYALDTTLDLEEGCSKQELLSAIESHTLEQCELIGLYEKTTS